MSSPEFSLVIPFYNEEANCKEVVDRLVEILDQHRIHYELIPVDNGSVDRTRDFLAQCATSNPCINVVTVDRNQGYGWGILSGLSQSTGKYVGYVDGDLQIPPDAIIHVFTHLKTHDADICKGTRIERGDGVKRRVISTVYNLIFKLLFNCSVRDVNAKPKILKHSCYTHLDLQSKDWFIDAELIIKADGLGMHIEEVPIDFRAREEGKSNVRMGAILEFFKNLLIYRLTARKQHQNVSQIQTTHRS